MSDPTPAQSTVADLYKQFRRSRQHDFAETTSGLYPQLRARARQLTRCDVEAQDVVQETYLRALEHWDKFFCPEGRRPTDVAGAWMWRILTNVFLSARRAELARPVVYGIDLGDEFGALDVGHDPAPIDYIARGIEGAFTSLGANARAVVVRADVLEMPHEEIAAALDVPVGTVKSRLSRARRAMADQIGDCPESQSRTRRDPPQPRRTETP